MPYLTNLRRAAEAVLWLTFAGLGACHKTPAAPPPKAASAQAVGHLAVRLAHVEELVKDLRLQLQLARERPSAQVPFAPQPAAPKGQGAGPAVQSETALAAGAQALAQGHLQLAQNQFAQALATAPLRGPQAARALLWLADTAVEQGAHRVAVHHLQRFMAEHADHPQMHEAALRLGLAHEALRAYADAHAIFATIVAKHPSSTSAQVAKVHLQRPKGARP